MKRGPLFAARWLCLILLLTSLAGLTGCGDNGSGGNGSAVQGAAVPDYEIPTISGSTIKLSQLRGKVVVLDFWATNCGPCRAETPHLVQIAEEYKDKGVTVIGIALDEDPDLVAKFVRDFKINYTIGFAPEGMFAKFDTSDDAAIPQTLIFGRDGRKIDQTIGFQPLDGGEHLRRTVELALKS